ncbi:MAG: thiosulfate/3-mercaptopyruvate sulfurtransferase [Cognaticolwellia sp.]
MELERDLSAVGEPKQGGRHPLPVLQAWCQTLGRLGVGPQTTVQVFDSAGGGLYAARVWWMLKAVGHAQVDVITVDQLEQEWVSERAHAAPLPPYPASSWALSTCSIDQVRLRANDPSWRLLDARSGVRFRGEQEPLDPVAGHIPGALSMPWEAHTDLGQAKVRFEQVLGGVSSTRSIVSCGSGVTACFLALQMHRLGLGIPTLYVGSWSEWCRQS